ncbi:MAG: sulfite exporter TauE/SafE family protein, partial [Flavobacteriia bacterium]|nr:sulfite exporter TauE/SafE family protein [Flavobacteriia bacterium]
AGAFSNIYFLVIKLPKNEFIGTAAWLFFIINLFKVPFHIWSWGTINTSSFQISMSLIPAVLLGFGLGVVLVKKINNNSYRKLILLLTGLGGLAILLQ